MNKVLPIKVIIYDTLAELSEVCALGGSSFIGESLVDEGGHNPLEPAYHGKPLISGTYMSDSEEISQELAACVDGVAVAD